MILSNNPSPAEEQEDNNNITETESDFEKEGDLLEIRVNDDLGEPDPEDKDLPPTDPRLPEEDEDDNADSE